MYLSSCIYLNDIYICANNARNRISPDERAPIGAFSSGITLLATQMIVIYVLIFMYISERHIRLCRQCF